MKNQKSLGKGCHLIIVYILTPNQGVQFSGYGYGQGIILNENYQVIKDDVQSRNGRLESDFHEMFIISGGETALHTIYQPSSIT